MKNHLLSSLRSSSHACGDLIAVARAARTGRTRLCLGLALALLVVGPPVPARAEPETAPPPACPAAASPASAPTAPAPVANPPPELAPVWVQTTGHRTLAPLTLTSAQSALAQVPGNTTFIRASDFLAGATGNLQNMVAFAPGVYAQDRAGPETHLSIRGSGISIPWVVKGVRLLANGLPLNEADGWYHSQLIEPLSVQYVEVYPGADALRYGASTLGGAINLVSYTGYTAPAFSSSLEIGSRGFLHAQAASGAVLNDRWDDYVSLSGLYSSGFRQHSRSNSTLLSGNLGYRHAGGAESRLYLDLADSHQELPGAITKAQLLADPSRANPGSEFFDAANDFQRYRLAWQHVRPSAGQGHLEAGLFVEAQNIHHPLPYFVLEKSFQTYGASLHGENTFDLLGRDHRFAWGGLVMLGDSRQEHYQPLGQGHKGRLWDTGLSDAATVELYAEDRIPLNASLQLVAGAQLAYGWRHTDTNFTDPGQPDTSPEKSYAAINPKLGLLWQPATHTQVFGNLSRSFEPPVLGEFDDAFSATKTKLEAQTATTLELGARHTGQRWRWQLAAYHSRVRHEILSVQVPPNSGRYETANAGRTIHQGLEFGLEGRLPLAGPGSDDLRLRVMYTLNHFRFDADPGFGDAQLPGQPRQFGRLELLYERLSGFYIGPTLDAASAYYVDYANTLKADAYVVLGARLGYKTAWWDIALEGVNLTDRRYASSTEVINNAGGQDQPAFLPGRGATVMFILRLRR